MIARIPLCCTSQAFQLLASQLPTMNSPDAMLQCACAIAMHQNPELDPASVDAALQRHTDTIRSRVHGDQPQALLAHLHDYLFEEQHFSGNKLDYYNPKNSYLPSVLETKLGLPITLSMVYRMIAERLGFRSWGVGLPGHFMAGLEIEGKPLLIDTFAGGRILTPSEAHDRMKEIFGPEIEWTDDLLRPASNRHWLTRMLQNLLNIFGTSGQYENVAAMLEMEILLWPEQTRLHRDLALVLARIGLSRPASAWLERYLSSNPDDPQTEDLRQLLDVLTT